MLYLAYQAQSDLLNPARMLAQSALAAIGARAMSGQPVDWRATAAAVVELRLGAPLYVFLEQRCPPATRAT